jgi:hypothetical protein
MSIIQIENARSTIDLNINMLDTSNMVLEIYNKMLEGDNKGESMRRQISIAIGVSVCLLGGFLMFHGSILGERTIGIARVVGIIGIGIITSSQNPALEMKREKDCRDA